MKRWQLVVISLCLIGSVLGELFAKPYARWCVTRMASDAGRHFSQRR